MPVYFVIGKWVPNPRGLGIYHIVKTIKGVYDESGNEWRKLWQEHITPIQDTGQFQIFVFVREPDNPFRAQVEL